VTAGAARLASEPSRVRRLASGRLRAGVLVGGLVTGTLAAAAPYLSSHEIPVSGYAEKSTATVAAHVAVGMSFLLVGLLAWSRRPENRVGPLMTAAGFAFFSTDLGWLHSPWPTVVADEWRGIFYAILFHLLLAFPSGRLQSRAERVLVVSTYLCLGLVRPFPSAAFFDASVEGPADLPRNPLLIRSDQGLNEAVDHWLSFGDLTIALLVVFFVISHWRRAGRQGRRALTPVFSVAGVVAVPMLVGMVFGYASKDTVLKWSVQLALALLPVGFLVGLLRSRLARSTVADLVIELQDAHDPGRIRAALARALDDPTLEIGYWVPVSGGCVDAHGAPLDLPRTGSGRATTMIRSDGEPVAVLIHDEALLDAAALVDAVAAAARLALENQRLQAELRSQLQEVRASRARIVAAGDAERRRLERDLHDGAQQRLLALGLALQLARAELGDGTSGAEQLLAEAETELHGALAELRDLARGIHPAILTGGGIGPALRTLTDRAPIPVALAGDPPRFPPAVETAAYFVVSEALANIAKHARATHASVSVTVEHGRALVVVEDDGVGGADPERGSGLRGLADRVQALDGSVEVETRPGGGTRIRAELPCA